MTPAQNEAIHVDAKFYMEKFGAKDGSKYSIQLVKTKNPDGLPIDVINKGKSKGGYVFTICGYNLPTEDQTFRYSGTWVKNPKYGTQLKVTVFELLAPTTKAGIAKFLSSKRFKGIGKKLAEDIVDVFGEETLSVIENEPEKMITIRGITLKKATEISETYKKSKVYSDLQVFLGTYGIQGEKVSAIYAKFGSMSKERIEKNPYDLCEVSGIGFMQADAIAKGLNIMLASQERVLAAIEHVLIQDMSVRQNLFMYKNDVYTAAMQLLNTPNYYVNEETFNAAFQWGLEQKKFFLHENGELFLEVSERAEENSSKALKRLLKQKVLSKEPDIEKALEKYQSRTDVVKLSQKQLSVVKEALLNKVFVITGGPGTGKTTIINCIKTVYEQVFRKNVTLLAPTGKAARRMTEATNYPASTIHSEIGIFNPEGLSDINEGLIVVDEVSMVDQFVFEKLLSCVQTGSHLLLVGDADQLPSVSAGNVLHELLNSSVIPFARLTEVFRQNTSASLIIENAARVNTGDVNLYVNDRFTFTGVNNEEGALEAILSIYEKECAEWGIENVLILCPLRHKRLVSVDNINSRLQNIVNPRIDGSRVVQVNGVEYRQDDRIIQMKNTEEASNGDIGVIQDISEVINEDEEKELKFTIQWENGGLSQYTREQMENVELAYALTIHKSQGSEAKSVIIPVLSSQRCQLFHRSLLYTAITRSKERVCIVGDRSAMDLMISNGGEIGTRNTMLGKRIQEDK